MTLSRLGLPLNVSDQVKRALVRETVSDRPTITLEELERPEGHPHPRLYTNLVFMEEW